MQTRPTDQFSARRPLNENYWETIPCSVAKCQPFLKGFVTEVDIGSPQDVYMRGDRSRESTQMINVEEGRIRFQFPAGTHCFREHKIPIERDPKLTIARGDRHGNHTERVQHRPVDWLDQFQENLHSRNERIKRG